MLYGRQPESDAIDRLLHQARTGNGGALVLRGEAGIGKTALLRYAEEQSGQSQVLRTAGVESETRLAFSGLHGLLCPVFGAIDRLPDPQASALKGALGLAEASGASRFLISAALTGLLSLLADDRPLVCLVDDVQWLDNESLDALTFAQRRLTADPVAMVFALRDGAEADLPTSLHRMPALRLGPLDADAVDQFLDEVLELSLDHRLRDAVIAAARGNPLALVELSAENALRTIGAEGLRLPLSARLERAFLHRIRALPETAQLLLLVAAADDTGQLGLILTAGETLGTSIRDLAALERAGLIRVQRSGVEFVHPLVRSAVYQSATFAERQRVHLSLADASGTADDDRRTWHRAAAALFPDEAVADDLEALGHSAHRRAALDAAVAAFDRAAELTADPCRRTARLVLAAEVSWEYGQADAARNFLERVGPPSGDRVTEARADHLKGRMLATTGVLLDGYELLVASAERIADLDPELAGAMLVDATRAASYSGDVPRVLAAGHRAGSLLVDGGPPSAATFVAGVAALLAGEAAVAAPLLRAALEGMEKEDDPTLNLWAGTACAYLGDIAGARAYGVRAVSRARETGAFGTLAQALELLAIGEMMVAPLMAEADAVEGLRLAQESGQHPSAAVHLSTIATVAALCGDEARAEDCAEQVAKLSATHGLAFPEARAVAALGLLDLGLGRPRQALERFLRLDRTELHASVSIAAAPDLIESAVRAGDPEAAAEALGKLDRWVEASGSPVGRALLARSRALLTDGSSAEELYEEALAAEVRQGSVVTRARTELLYGEFLRRERRRAEARPHLRAAWTTFESFNARPWAERAQAELRATGESVRRRGAAPTEDLTPQELQIARLVATGASSKEVAARLFLSPRTVDYHLRKIFTKTGITSRNQLSGLDLDG